MKKYMCMIAVVALAIASQIEASQSNTKNVNRRTDRRIRRSGSNPRQVSHNNTNKVAAIFDKNPELKTYYNTHPLPLPAAGKDGWPQATAALFAWFKDALHIMVQADINKKTYNNDQYEMSAALETLAREGSRNMSSSYRNGMGNLANEYVFQSIAKVRSELTARNKRAR